MNLERKFYSREGVKIAIHPYKGESFSLKMICKGGKTLERRGKEGTSSLMSNLFLHGCMGKAYQEIVESLEGMGTSLFMASDFESVGISMWSLRENALKSAEILVQCLKGADFPEEEIEKEKTRIRSELKRIWDEPEEAAARIFASKVFGDHPYSRLENSSSLEKIQRQDLFELKDKSFKRAGSYIAMSGDYTDVEKVLSLLLSALSSGQVQVKIDRPSPGEGKIYFYLKEDAQQVQIRLGHPSFPRNYPYYEEALVFNYALGGGGFSSRLMERVRAKGGLTYSIRSSFSPMLYAGIFSISTFTRPENTLKTLEVIIDEVKKAVKDGITPEEVEKAKSYYIGHFPLTLETPSQISSLLASILFFDLGEDYPERFLEKMGKLTANSVNRVKEEIIYPDKLIKVVVGPEQALKDLEKFGEVEMVRPEY